MDHTGTISLERLYVCGGSAGLFGVIEFDGNPPSFEQLCIANGDPYRKDASHQPRTELPPPTGDCPTAFELCYCCASVVIRTGSKFSRFFCGYCGNAAQALFDRAGSPLIPLGRHSVTNGIGLTGAAANDPDQLAAFVAATKGLAARIDRLKAWQRLVVADHIDSISPGASHVTARAYGAYVEEFAASPPEMFRQLVRYFGIPDGVISEHGQEDS